MIPMSVIFAAIAVLAVYATVKQHRDQMAATRFPRHRLGIDPPEEWIGETDWDFPERRVG